MRRRLHQVIPPAKTSTGFSRDFSSAISGFRSLCGRKRRSSLKPSRSNGPAFWNLSLGAGSRFENSGLHPQYPFGVSTGPATLDRCCDRNVVAPGEYSKWFFCIPIGLYRGNFRPATALWIPARSALGGRCSVNPAAAIRPSTSPLWPCPISTTRMPPGASSCAACGRARDRRQGRRRRRPVRQADHDRALRSADRRFRPSGYRAGSTRSGRTVGQRRRIIAGHESRAIGEPEICRIAACCLSAASLMSVPIPKVSGSSDSIASKIAPEPVPMSAIRSGRSGCGAARSSPRQFDDGFGVGPWHKRCRRKMQGQSPEFLLPENPGDRLAARRRRMKSSRHIASSGVRGRVAAVIRPVRSRPQRSRPTRIARVEFGAKWDLSPIIKSRRERTRRADSTVCPAKEFFRR